MSDMQRNVLEETAPILFAKNIARKIFVVLIIVTNALRILEDLNRKYIGNNFHFVVFFIVFQQINQEISSFNI